MMTPLIRRAKPVRTRAAIAVVVAIAIGAAVVARAQISNPGTPVGFNPQPDPPGFAFGLIGLTRGQTARLSVANLGLTPPDPNLPPPCRVMVSFVDVNGAPLVNDDGQPVRRSFTLEAGHAAFLQINGDVFVGRAGGDVGTNGAPLRVNFRPIVALQRRAGEIPPPCIPSFEVIDNATAQMLVLNPGVKVEGRPDSNNHNETLVRDREN